MIAVNGSGIGVAHGPAKERDESELVHVGRLLLRFWWLLVAGTLIGGGYRAMNLPADPTPVYRAEVLVSSGESGGGSAGFAALASKLGGLFGGGGGGGGSSSSSGNLTIATLKSRVFAEEFIHDNGLMQAFYSGLWDAEAGKWRVPEDRVPTMWDAYKRYSGIIDIESDELSGLTKVAILWEDPVLAARWANALVAQINAHMREKALAQSENNLAYLRQQMSQATLVEIRQALTALMESELQNAMLANGRHDPAFRVIDPAVVPQDPEPVDVNKRRMVVLGAAFGLMVALVLALILNFAMPRGGSSRKRRQEDGTADAEA